MHFEKLEKIGGGHQASQLGNNEEMPWEPMILKVTLKYKNIIITFKTLGLNLKNRASF